jgi:MFS family permease
MISPAKALFYLIEFINIYAAVYYSNFLFFYLRRTFGFGEVENLLTAAIGGFVYIIAAWQSGKWADRYGCIRMLDIGACGIILSLALGAAFPAPTAQVVVYGLWTAGICFIWPSLEALISDRAGVSLPKLIGIYNVTWAAGGAVGYFTAGMLLEKLGMTSLFWLPLGLTVVELALIAYAARLLKKENDRQSCDTPLAHLAQAVNPR